MNASRPITIVLGGLVSVLLVTGCGHDNSAKGVAEEFLYRYFIELNQQGALQVSEGLAQDKLKKEIELLKGVRSAPDLDLSKSKPFIDYKLMETRQMDEQAIALFYDVSIKSKGGDKYKRQVVLTTSPVNGVWKVVNFDTYPVDSP
ncbi:MAG: hypothetical protein ACE5HO_15910 [bacterium]